MTKPTTEQMLQKLECLEKTVDVPKDIPKCLTCGRKLSCVKAIDAIRSRLLEHDALKAEVEKWKSWYEERKDVAEATRGLFNEKVDELKKAEAELADPMTKCERCPFGTMLKEYQEDDEVKEQGQ